MIKHIWFDFDGTLTVQTPEFHAAHNELRYQTYARAIGQPLTEQLKQDYEALYKKYASNSAVFRSLGLPSDYWQAVVNDFDVSSFYKPVPAIYETLDTLRKKVPISLFTNLKPQKVHEILPQINIPFSWFTHYISGDDIKERKPALDGFYKMIELSQVPPHQILYVGDRIDVDIIPAKAVGITTCFLWGTIPEADYSCVHFEDILKIL